MTTVAILNSSGILVGYERGFPDDYTPKAGEIFVDDECDLVPLKYQWIDISKTFIPLPPEGSSNAAKDINVLRAIFRGFQSIETRFPGTLSGETKDWLAQFANSIDNLKAV